MIIWIIEIVKTIYQVMIDGVIEITISWKLKLKSCDKKSDNFNY